MAKLRYLHGWSRQKMARHYGRTPDAITNYCQSIRRNNFELDVLIVEEKRSKSNGPIKIDFLSVGTGNLPWILKQVQKAQFELIQDSKANKWPKAMGIR